MDIESTGGQITSPLPAYRRHPCLQVGSVSHLAPQANDLAPTGKYDLGRALVAAENRRVYDLMMVDGDNLAQEILNATSELIDVLRDAQGALEHLIEGVSEVRARMERGEEIDLILVSSNVDAYRHVVDEGMDKFELWRRIARGSVIRVALEAGMTLTEIAEEFGFSRTYVRQLAQEPPSPPNVPR